MTNLGWLVAGAAALLGAFLIFGLTFVFYIAVMRLKHMTVELHWIGRALVWPWVIFGVLVLDIIIVNWVIGSVLFIGRRPLTITFTSTLSRMELRADWRGRFARWICEELLEPFDPGHC